MEKELNIAAILKDKPRDTSLYSPIFGLCGLDEVNTKWEKFPISVIYKSQIKHFRKDGRFHLEGECMLFPSKEMRDWSKFAWKKGDVLEDQYGYKCIFEEWANEDYTKFNGCYGNSKYGHSYYSKVPNAETMKYKKASNDASCIHIREIERNLGGKLNLSTLQIEQPKQEFKDGDIVTAKFYDDKTEMICIFKEKDDEFYMGYCGVFSTGELKGRIILDFGEDCIGEDNECNLRIATDSEKQQLLSSLAKIGKKWNPDTLQIEDLPKKCELKPFDYFIAKDKNESEAIWILYQYAFTYKEYKRVYMVNGDYIREDLFTILPYNDSTKHLLGTTDEWKGGEE